MRAITAFSLGGVARAVRVRVSVVTPVAKATVLISLRRLSFSDRIESVMALLRRAELPKVTVLDSLDASRLPSAAHRNRPHPQVIYSYENPDMPSHGRPLPAHPRLPRTLARRASQG